MTYIANVGYLLTRLYIGLGIDFKQKLLFVQVEAIYAIFFLTFIKIILPCYTGAMLHEKVFL